MIAVKWRPSSSCGRGSLWAAQGCWGVGMTESLTGDEADKAWQGDRQTLGWAEKAGRRTFSQSDQSRAATCLTGIEFQHSSAYLTTDLAKCFRNTEDLNYRSE